MSVAPTPRMETPAQIGRRLAMAAFPKSHSLTARKIRTTIRKRLAAHTVQPRATGSHHFKFKLDLAPMNGVKELCEEAGLAQQPTLRRHGLAKIIRQWKTDGASATAKLGSLQETGHPLAWGGAKLKGPAKGAARPVCRVMMLLAPRPAGRPWHRHRRFHQARRHCRRCQPQRRHLHHLLLLLHLLGLVL